MKTEGKRSSAKLQQRVAMLPWAPGCTKKEKGACFLNLSLTLDFNGTFALNKLSVSKL